MAIVEDPESNSILSEALKDIDGKQGSEEALIDEIIGEGSTVGVIVRTDYSDDSAWSGFVEAVRSAENELNALDEDMDEEAVDEPSSSVQNESGAGSESESEGEDEGKADPLIEGSSTRADEDVSLFVFVSPSETSPLRSELLKASNLKVARIFNDVTVENVPPLPPDSRRIKQGHRLVDMDGLVEVYEGMSIWIYDERSNRDRAARLVSLRPDSYGSAT